VVYLAEQEEPVRRMVALKVIKLGMDTRQVVARFEAERQALALMDHPNIARVLDAGATETGRPYFVMELVEGTRITKYCDEHRLTTRQRLELFIQVCHAVQHAHQKGIIHRDIKPSNVLVARPDPDSPGAPKVIDFGIAKATQGRLADQTYSTTLEQLIGTPAYMSPEQAQLGSVDVDTRSDIYSLGVLLYELLTGTTPFDTKEMLAGGLDEIRRTIREVEPTRPSSRLRQEILAHSAGPEKSPTRTLDKDLDWIVMKCLEKDRTRRYATVNGLASDIQRHLNNEPVTARPPSAVYRLQKSAKRHRVAFAASTAVAGALVLGVLASAWQAVRATHAERVQSSLLQQARTAQANEARQRAKAQTEAGKNLQVVRFLRGLLKGTIPAATGGRDSGVLKQILDKTKAGIGIGEDLASQPELEMDLRSALADAYQDLGFYSEAEAEARTMLEVGGTRLHPEHPAIGKAYRQLGVALAALHKIQEARHAIEQALAIQTRAQGLESLEAAESLNALGNVLRDQEERQMAETMLRRALALRRKLLGNENVQVAESLNDLGNAVSDRPADAENLYREALELRRRLLGEEHPYVAATLDNLAVALHKQGKLSQAETILWESVELGSKRLGIEHPDVLKSRLHLGRVLSEENKLAEAETELRETVAIHRRSMNVAEAADPLDDLVDVLLRENKPDEAERLLNELVTPETENLKENDGLLGARVDFYARRGRWKEAMVDAQHVIDFSPQQKWHYFLLALILASEGDAESYCEHCQQMFARFGDTRDPGTAELVAKSCLLLPKSVANLDAVSRLADVAVAAGQGHRLFLWFELCKGLAEYRQGHYAATSEWVQKILPQHLSSEDDDLHYQAQIIAAMACYQMGRTEDARAALDRAADIARSKLPSPESQDLGSNWWDRLIGHTLFKEAKLLIEENRGQKQD
jgi:tetratricopeptide (TPR) repeat protein